MTLSAVLSCDFIPLDDSHGDYLCRILAHEAVPALTLAIRHYANISCSHEVTTLLLGISHAIGHPYHILLPCLATVMVHCILGGQGGGRAAARLRLHQTSLRNGGRRKDTHGEASLNGGSRLESNVGIQF